jgi:hypothetical protein
MHFLHNILVEWLKYNGADCRHGAKKLVLGDSLVPPVVAAIYVKKQYHYRKLDEYLLFADSKLTTTPGSRAI